MMGGRRADRYLQVAKLLAVVMLLSRSPGFEGFLKTLRRAREREERVEVEAPLPVPLVIPDRISQLPEGFYSS